MAASTTKTWSEDWEVYMGRVNDDTAAIRVDLGLGPVVPIPEKTYLLWAWVYFQSPREDGLVSSEEAPRVYEVEDALVPELENTCRAILAGCITTQGRREFYFYAETIEDFHNAVERAMQAFPDYRFELGSQLEADWKQYVELLYPSPDKLDSLSNAKVLRALHREGDVHELPRGVTHWLYFPRERGRTDCAAAAQEKGYSSWLDPELVEREGNPFALTLDKIQPVTQADIDTTTHELRALAERFGGEYDGWEAQATASLD